jgi:flagellar L-ring protein precursor FlgH
MRLRVLMLSAAVTGTAGASAAFGQNAAVPRDATNRPLERRAEGAPVARENQPQQDGQMQQISPSPAQPGGEGAQVPRADTDLLRSHGNSLLKASLASRPNPEQAQLKDVSFYAVPVPEPKVIRKHDLVTIIIREDSSFSSDASTESKRTSSIDAALTDWIKLNIKNFEIEGGGIGPVAPSVKGNFNRNFKGEGTLDRSDKFSARITAEVLDVKPNGTLVLQARKRIKTDEEEQVFTLTGTCRAEDITADNTILSTSLHDQELTKNHKGSVRNASRKGWGGKLLDALSPF